MVKPLRIDSQGLGEQPLSRRPILLARLPRVGEAVAMEAAEPALVVVSEEPEVGAAPATKSTTSYFVDPSHLADSSVESPTTAEQRADQNQVSAPFSSSGSSTGSSTGTSSGKKRRRTKASSGRSSQSIKQSSKRTPQSAGLAYVYCKIHEQFAPFAGAIVALALVSAAGLMYWMISSPSSSSFNYPEMVNGDTDLAPIEIPPFVPRSSPLPIPENTGLAAPAEESESLVQEAAKPQAMALNSGELAESAKTQTGNLNIDAGMVLNIPPVTDSPGLVSVSTPEPTEVAKTEVIKAEVAKPEVSVELSKLAPVYPATTYPQALDFSRILAIGKSGLLGQSAGAAVANQQNVQNFAPTQR